MEEIRGALIVTESSVYHATFENSHDNVHEKPTITTHTDISSDINVCANNNTNEKPEITETDTPDINVCCTDEFTTNIPSNNLEYHGFDVATADDGQKRDINFTEKYSLTMHNDENTATEPNAGGSPDDDVQMTAASDCIVSTDQSHEAVIHGNQSENLIQKESDIIVSNPHGIKDRGTDDECIHVVDDIEKKQEVIQDDDDGDNSLIIIENAKPNTTIDLTLDDTDVKDTEEKHADNNDDELTELPSHYPSLKHHLPRQQTIENAMKNNQARKQNSSLTRDPSLAWDDFQTSYNNDDDNSYYVEDIDDNDYGENYTRDRLDEQNFAVHDDDNNDTLIQKIDDDVQIQNSINSSISDEMMENKKKTETMIDDLTKDNKVVTEPEVNTDKTEIEVKCRDYDSASDKATEMYESVENESISSEGDSYPIHALAFPNVNTEQKNDHEHKQGIPVSNENTSDERMSENLDRKGELLYT